MGPILSPWRSLKFVVGWHIDSSSDEDLFSVHQEESAGIRAEEPAEEPEEQSKEQSERPEEELVVVSEEDARALPTPKILVRTRPVRTSNIQAQQNIRYQMKITRSKHFIDESSDEEEQDR